MAHPVDVGEGEAGVVERLRRSSRPRGARPLQLEHAGGRGVVGHADDQLLPRECYRAHRLLHHAGSPAAAVSPHGASSARPRRVCHVTVTTWPSTTSPGVASPADGIESDPTVSLLHEQRQVARDRIEEAARRVLATKGLGATVEEVASEAGVSIRTVFRHYGTRDHMIATALRSQLHHYSDTLPVPGPEATLEAWLPELLLEVHRVNAFAGPGLLGDGRVGGHPER